MNKSRRLRPDFPYQQKTGLKPVFFPDCCSKLHIRSPSLVGILKGPQPLMSFRGMRGVQRGLKGELTKLPLDPSDLRSKQPIPPKNPIGLGCEMHIPSKTTKRDLAKTKSRFSYSSSSSPNISRNCSREISTARGLAPSASETMPRRSISSIRRPARA